MRSSPGPRLGQAPLEPPKVCGWKNCTREALPGQLRCSECALVIERPKPAAPPRVRRQKVTPRNMRPQVRAITEAVSNAYGGIPLDEVRGRASEKSVTLVRMVSMYAIRHCTSMSYPEIGTEFCRDNTTALSAVRRVAGMVANQDAQVLYAVGAGITAGKRWAERVLNESEVGKAAE